MAQRKAASPVEVPTTALAILGLLSFGEMSGYDLKKFAEASIGNFFSPAKSHIYAELRRLVALGYAAQRQVRQRQRPDKRVYRITPKGDEALRAWLASPQSEPEVSKSPALLKVFFGHLIDDDTLTDRVRQAREDHRKKLDGYLEIEREIKHSDEMFFPYLTLKAGIAHTRASIRWADEVLQLLEQRPGRPAPAPTKSKEA